MAGLVVGFLVLVGLFLLAFLVLPNRLVRACCLTTDQRLQAEAAVRSAGVQALGGLALVVTAGGGLYFTWRQVLVGQNQVLVALESNRDQFQIARNQLAANQTQISASQAHERKMATEERRQARLGGAYVDLLEAVIATTTYLGFHVQAASVRLEPPPPSPPDAPSEKEMYIIAAKLYAFGSSRVTGLFREFLDEAAQVNHHRENWNSTTMRELVRLESVIQDRVHAELEAFGEPSSGGSGA